MLSAIVTVTVFRRLVIVALLSSTAFASKPAKIPCEVLDREKVLCPNRDIYATLRVILYVEMGLPVEILDGSIVRFYSRDGSNFVDWKDSKGNVHTHQFKVQKVSMVDERDN